MSTKRELLQISQFDLLDNFKNSKSVWTPWGAVMIESLSRISEKEYQLWLRPLLLDEVTPYYLKMNGPGFLHVLYRWESKEQKGK